MVKALDAVPYDERQWGHWLARNVINTKQKLGLGVKQHTTAWSEQLVDELHKPIKRKFPKRRVIVNHHRRHMVFRSCRNAEIQQVD